MTKMKIERSGRFKRDFKREFKTHGADLDNMILDVLAFLIMSIPLSVKYGDHKLTGDWEGCRDCHLKPDLIMIYEMADDVLKLHRLGSHAELFG